MLLGRRRTPPNDAFRIGALRRRSIDGHPVRLPGEEDEDEGVVGLGSCVPGFGSDRGLSRLSARAR